MRCASGASYAITALKMTLFTLVCLRQVPGRAAQVLDPTRTTPREKPTPYAKSSSSFPSNTGRDPLYKTDEDMKSPWTLRTITTTAASTSRNPAEKVSTTTDTMATGLHGSTRHFTRDRGSLTTGEVVLESTTSSPDGMKVCNERCDDIMVRKQGMCGCSEMNAKKPLVKSSGIKKRSVLNKYARPVR